MIRIGVLVAAVLLMAGCSGRQPEVQAQSEEDREAKALMQGVWVDAETEDPTFRVAGDTIFYADSTSMPAYFRIISDSLVLASGTRYAIERHSENLFWFKNQNGDLIKLRKAEEADSIAEFVHDKPAVMTYTQQVKRDSVVMFNGERYHWYVAINPTRYKVVLRTYNDDGMEVENVYYDNIMHISVFNGARQLFSSDFRKQQYNGLVPQKFLEEAVLSDMEYSKVDAQGLHFIATLCVPDGASCYQAETVISYKGEVTKKLIEY